MEFTQYIVQEHDECKAKPSPQESQNTSDCNFDCSICLSPAHEPVITLCGHLYCWPCIYKWFDFHTTSSLSSDKTPQCPVCKSHMSLNSIIPLYGRGQSISEESESGETNIPPRPHTSGVLKGLLSNDSQDSQNHSYALSDPMVFGEMVYARVFGNSQSLFTYPNSYHNVSSSSRRLRRREIEADKSLNRVTVFLFCCIVLCLLVF